MRKNLRSVLPAILLVLESGVGDVSACGPPSGGGSKECVVLLHGLGRTGLSMKPLEWFLERRGYRVVNITYPSLRVPIEKIADHELDLALGRRVPQNAGRVHFVTHSAGGILLRQYLATHRVEDLGRVVMLGPPSHGSEQADRYQRSVLARWLIGPNLPRLGTASDALPQTIGPANFEVGIIAGDRPVFRWHRKDAARSDGKISVASTRLTGMADFLVVHHSHTFMIWNRATMRQIGAFLQHGRFPRGDQ
jgi:triacylglycerol lipase